MRKISILLILSLLFSSLHAQDKISLSDAIEKGLKNNYQIKITDRRVEQAKLMNNWGTVGRYPSVNLSLNLNNKFDNADSRSVPGTRDEFTTNTLYPNINARWTLFNGYGINISKEKLELLESFSEGNAAVIIENTIQSIILAYYKVKLEHEKLEVLDNIKALSSDRYLYVKQKFDLGSSVTYDLLQAKNAYLNDSSNFLFQKLNVKNAHLNFNLLLGEESSVKYELSDDLYMVAETYQLGDLLDKMLSDNKTLQNQYINQEILKKEVAFKKSSLFPVVSVSTGFDHFNFRTKYSGMDASFSNAYDFYANVTLSFNLFNGGNTRRAIENAQIDERIGELSIAEIQLQLKNVLVNLYDLFSIRKQLYEVSISNLESAELNLKLSEEKFKAGVINSFNFRDIQLLYLNVATQKLESMYNLIDTHTELVRLTGGIIAE
jgi:outer membrane protein